jgi:hypothetical protein
VLGGRFARRRLVQTPAGQRSAAAEVLAQPGAVLRRQALALAQARDPENELGFLRSERRINIAMSHGQDAFIIVGDPRFCRQARGGENRSRTAAPIEVSEGCKLGELANDSRGGARLLAGA